MKCRSSPHCRPPPSETENISEKGTIPEKETISEEKTISEKESDPPRARTYEELRPPLASHPPLPHRFISDNTIQERFLLTKS